MAKHNLSKKAQNYLYGFRRKVSGPIVPTDAQVAACQAIQPGLSRAEIVAYAGMPFNHITRTYSAAPVAVDPLVAARTALAELVAGGLSADDAAEIEMEISEQEDLRAEAARTEKLAALRALIASAK